jgi:thioredoxin 1
MSDAEILFFHAEWCGPCSQQEPIMDEIEDAHDDVTVTWLDVDDHTELANQYNVRSVPMTVVEVGGDVEKSFMGVTQRDDIESYLPG